MQRTTAADHHHRSYIIDLTLAFPSQVRKACDLIITIAFEIFSLVMSGPVALLGLSHNFTYFGLNPKSLKGNRAVLLLHGDNPGNQATFLPLAYRMQQAGFDNVFSCNIQYNSKDPVEHLDKIFDKVEEIEQLRNDITKPLTLDIVGHSRGGFEAIYFAICRDNLKRPKNVTFNKIVTIASRQKITNSGRRSCPEDIKKHIAKIQQAMAKYYEPSIYNLAPANDWDWIVPQEASYVVQNDKKRHLVSWTSHLSILYSSETHAKVIKYLS